MLSDIIKTWETDNYRLMVEEREGCYFLHCDVFQKYLSSVVELRDVLRSEVRDWALGQGQEVLFSYTQNPKFVTTIIPEAITIHKEKAGEVFAWELD